MMIKTRRSSESGFSLIELMLVVAILGILASVAVPAFVRQMRKARTVEAVESLSTMAAGAESFHARDQRFPYTSCDPDMTLCTAAATPTPTMTLAESCASHGGVYPRSSLKDFDSEPWNRMLFSASKRIRYRYTYASVSTRAGAWADIAATGDLDCDTELSVWRVKLERTGEHAAVTRIGPYLYAGLASE